MLGYCPSDGHFHRATMPSSRNYRPINAASNASYRVLITVLNLQYTCSDWTLQ